MWQNFQGQAVSALIIPGVIVAIIAYTCVKRQNAYKAFVDGARGAKDLVLDSLPYIVAIFIAIELFRESGLSMMVANMLAPILNILGIPKELAELVVIKNFSGSGSLCVLENIYAVYGVDSYIARCASCVCSCSEAVFYITSVYFVKTDVQKFRYAIPVAILSSVCGAVIGCAVCRVL